MSSSNDKSGEQCKAGAAVDLHTTKSAGIFEVPPDKVTHDQRTFAKAVNYGLIYGVRSHHQRFKRL